MAEAVEASLQQKQLRLRREEELTEHKSRRLKRREVRRQNMNDFDLLKVLGQGAYGKVFLARHKMTRRYLALKAVHKAVIVGAEDYEITLTEKNVLAMGNDCPFITKLFCSFQTPNSCVFVMEYLSGGDLYFHMRKVEIFLIIDL